MNSIMLGQANFFSLLKSFSRAYLFLCLCLCLCLCLFTGLGYAASNNLQNCIFQSKGLALNFGQLDPSNAFKTTTSMVAASISANTAGNCSAVNMFITADNGLYAKGNTRRLKNGNNSNSNNNANYIDYQLQDLPQSVLKAPGQNAYISFSFSGTILSTAYENAAAGQYSDSVTISVNP